MKLVVVCVVVVSILFVAIPVGIHSQTWSRWWFVGSTLQPPGTVPILPPPQGPLPSEGLPLLQAIQPWMGVPYLFGGCTLHGVDCSCFVQLVYRAVGIALPRTAQAQYDAVQLVTDPQIGDLVFFRATYQSPDSITHVGILVADGMMISAAEPAVGRQSLATPFWRAHYVGVGRPRR